MTPPLQITHGKAIRKPVKLPDNAENVHLHDETVAFLDTLRVFEIDGEYLYQEEFPTKDRYYILWDYTTNLAWLADSSGFNYPRYVININPYRPKILDNPENIPESRVTAKGLLEAEGDEFDFHHSPRAPRPAGKIDPKGLKTLVGEVSAWQERNPYPDYGILWVNQDTGKVIYTVGDGQEGDLDDLEDLILGIPGVTDFELADEWSPSTSDGFTKIWQQNKEIKEMTSSMTLGSAPVAPKKKKQKVDTSYKGSWADTMKTTDWKKLQPKSHWVKLNQSTELIGSLLEQANEGSRIEAYGVKGMNSTPWRKSFKSQADFEKWLEKNDGNVEVQGVRKLDESEGLPHDRPADLSKIPTDKLRELVSVQRHAAQKNPRAFDSAKRGAEELYHRSGQVIPIYGPDGSGVVFNGSEWIAESENLEKHKFEVVCLNASGEEVSTKSFSSEEDAQSYIDKKEEKREEDEVGCSYKIRVVAKEHKDQFAMDESKDKIRVGSKVHGIMGVHGNSSGTVTKVGSPYSSSGSPTVWVKSDDGREWDTFAFNLRLTESLSECNHGDIIRLVGSPKFPGYMRRPGYFRVDTQEALGASEERPWVENLDTGTGFYFDMESDSDAVEVVIPADEYNTMSLNSSQDVDDLIDTEEFGGTFDPKTGEYKMVD